MLNAISWRAIVFCFCCSIFEVFGVLEITGDISFDLLISDGRKKQDSVAVPVARSLNVSDNVTVAPVFECQYQYPELRQVDAMLSHMMNMLTKVFVRVNEYVAIKTNRRAMSRFKKVGASKRTDFFDDIYANMTREFRAYANKTWAQVPRAWTSRDPCLHQNEIKGIWRDLLDTSANSLRHAAQDCAEKYLAAEGSQSKRVRSHVAEIQRAELARIKPELLELLCDSFQLCYHDLI